jgi:hypothetical protein
MEFIKIKCSKCGYEIEIPETTVSVVCGSCGNVNHFGKISSILKKYSDGTDSEFHRNTRFPSEIKKPSYTPIPGQNPVPPETNIPSDDEDAEFPEEKNASKILTLIFILAPFIAMAVEFFKFPSYVAVLIIILVIITIVSIKKKFSKSQH